MLIINSNSNSKWEWANNNGTNKVDRFLKDNNSEIFRKKIGKNKLIIFMIPNKIISQAKQLTKIIMAQICRTRILTLKLSLLNNKTIYNRLFVKAKWISYPMILSIKKELETLCMVFLF